MNLTLVSKFSKRSTPGLRRFCRVLTAISCVVVLTGVSVHADPVHLNKVVQTLSNQGAANLQLTLITQDPAPSGTKGSTTSPAGPRNDNAASNPKTEIVVPGGPIISATGTIGVDDITEDGEVEGTICDCGEILIAGGGFPKWPLLFLAAVPLAFIDTGEECEDCSQTTPTPTPTPTPNSSPTPTPTPEPASLLIFGTGLLAVGAGLRRRYTRSKLESQIQNTEENN